LTGSGTTRALPCLIAGRRPFLCWPAGFAGALPGTSGSSRPSITRGMLQHIRSAGGPSFGAGTMLFGCMMRDVGVCSGGVSGVRSDRGVRQIHRTGSVAAAGGEFAGALPFLL
jgi:hypothetical protein